MSLPWADKYRPETIDEFVFQNSNYQEMFKHFIADQSIPHLLLSGHRGSGKTSMAYLLQKTLCVPDSDFKKLNASKENSVDDVRTIIQPFISTAPTGDNQFKIVFMDEADALSPAAQKALCSMMEDYVENVRFIFTCNKPHKILPEIQSRCTFVNFQVIDKESACIRALHILRQEKVKIKDVSDVVNIIESNHPDLRKTLNTLQRFSTNGVLEISTSEEHDGNDPDEIITDIIMKGIGDGDWKGARELIASFNANEGAETFFNNLGELIHEFPEFEVGSVNWRRAIIIICDHYSKMPFVADQRINMLACMLRIMENKDE